MNDSGGSHFEESVERAIDLVNGAGKLAQPGENEIFITWPYHFSAFDAAPRSRWAWRQVLRGAMERGWNVTLLMSARRRFASTEIVDDILELVGASAKFTPTFVQGDTLLMPRRELVIVPGVGAVEMSGPERNAPRSYMQGSDLVALAANVLVLAESCTSLIESYPRVAVGFAKAITALEDEAGHRYLVMNGLSDLTLPPEFHIAREARLRSSNPRVRQVVPQIVFTRVNRYAAFDRQVTTWNVYDVCPMRAIQDYVANGIHTQDDVFLDFGWRGFKRADRKKHLTWFAQRVRTIERYHFGLLDTEQTEALEYLSRAFWFVKDDHRVLLEFDSTRVHGTAGSLAAHISEPALVAAFSEHFKTHIWDRIPAHQKDREWVSQWLEQQASRV